MRVLLFDMHVGGHHLEYASQLRSHLSDHLPEAQVDFLAAAESEQHHEFFDISTIDFLYEDDVVLDELSPDGIGDNLRRAIKNPRDDIVARLFKYVSNHDYDILHLLHLDDIVGEVHRHGRGVTPEVVGTINGSYYRIQSYRRTEIARALIATHLTEIVSVVPDILSRRGPWNHLNLYRAIRDDVIGELFVPTHRGRDSIQRAVQADTLSYSLIPDPIEPWYEDPIPAADARKNLGLPTEPFTLVFFGEMRAEKGVDLLIDALASYDGDSMTAVFAGRPVDIDPTDFEVLKTNDAVDVRTELGFVPHEDVKSYFFAADAMVLPYRRSFGQFRPSGVFQKACGSLRPIIAPSFGVFDDLVTEWDLGVTFEPGSAKSLREAIASLHSSAGGLYNVDTMREYATSQTYDNLAAITVETYLDLLSRKRDGVTSGS